MVLLFPDATQLRAIDETETHYVRALLPAQDYPVELPSGEILGGCYVYVNRHGVLVDAAGSPRKWIKERDLLSALVGESKRIRERFGATPEEFVKRAAASDDLRTLGATLFREEGWVLEQPELNGLTSGSGQKVYADLAPTNSLPAGVARVGRMPDIFEHRGAGAARLSDDLLDGLGKPSLVFVERAEGLTEGGEPSGALAAVISSRRSSTLASRTIELDLSVRVAIGAEIGENVFIHPIKPSRRRFADVFFGTPTYVICRVQPADRVTAEHEMALLDELTLEMLGMLSGDEIELEGLPDVEGRLRRVRVKAFSTPDSVRERREELHGGGFASRYPSARDALGVHPDLPWIFIDARLRDALGLAGKKLGAVRVRCSRRDQAKKEIRELLLVLAIAFVGLVTIVDKTSLQIAGMALLMAIIGSAVLVRLRNRFRMSTRVARIGRR